MGEVMNRGLIHVTRPDQAERMRIMRNSCREFMTGDQHEITAEEQAQWFAGLPDDATVLPFLYDGGRRPYEIVGYGLIRKMDDRWWVSGGLLPEHRGKGLGKDLFLELADYVHQAKHTPCWLKVFASNARAWKTYEAIGFVHVVVEGTEVDGRTILTYRKDVP